MPLQEIILSVAMLLQPYNLELPPIDYLPRQHELMKGNRLGVTACSPKFKACQIVINQCLESNPRLVRSVLIHELAHYVDFMSDLKLDQHKGEWKQIMLSWNQVPNATYRNRLPVNCAHVSNSLVR